MRIGEPRDALLPFLTLWGGLFGGIPLLLLAVLPKQDAPAFLLLFPLVAFVVFSFGLRRSRRAGFRLTPAGLEGAHDAEEELVPWEDVRALVWRRAPDTSGVTVNGRPRPPGDALHLLLSSGETVRVMQRVARSPRSRSRIDAQLMRARADGVLPVEVLDAREVTGEGERLAHRLDGPGTITWEPGPPDPQLGTLPPQLDTLPSAPPAASTPTPTTPPPPPSAWPPPPPVTTAPSPDPALDGDPSAEPDPAPPAAPFWPTKDDGG